MNFCPNNDKQTAKLNELKPRPTLKCRKKNHALCKGEHSFK